MDMFRNLGLAISVIRTMRGMSQAGVAQAAGIGKSQLSKYENGKELPKLDSLEKILQVLKVSSADFFYTADLLNKREGALLKGGAGELPSPFGMSLLADESEGALFPFFRQLFDLYASLAGEKIRLGLDRLSPNDKPEKGYRKRA